MKTQNGKVVASHYLPCSRVKEVRILKASKAISKLITRQSLMKKKKLSFISIIKLYILKLFGRNYMYIVSHTIIVISDARCKQFDQVLVQLSIYFYF